MRMCIKTRKIYCITIFTTLKYFQNKNYKKFKIFEYTKNSMNSNFVISFIHKFLLFFKCPSSLFLTCALCPKAILFFTRIFVCFLFWYHALPYFPLQHFFFFFGVMRSYFCLHVFPLVGVYYTSFEIYPFNFVFYD